MKKKIFLILAIFLFEKIAFSYTETFYVSASGDGSAPETIAGSWDASDFSNASNWASGVDSNDGKIGANDQVIILDDDGNFTQSGGFRCQGSGTSGSPITINAESGATIVIDGNNSDSFGFRHAEHDYVTYDFTDASGGEITIKNTTGSGFNAYDSSGDVRNSLEIHGVATENVGGHGIWIVLDTVTGTLATLKINDCGADTSGGYGIYAYAQHTSLPAFGDVEVLRFNTTNNNNEGVRIDDADACEVAYGYSFGDGTVGASCIMFAGNFASDLNIHHNYLKQDKNDGTVAENIWVGGSWTGVDIHNNICIDAVNHKSVHIDGGQTNVQVYNNTFYNVNGCIVFGANSQATNCSAQNNVADEVVDGQPNCWVRNSSTIGTIDYNCWDEEEGFQIEEVSKTWAEWNTAGYDDTGGKYEDCKYADGANYDFTLQASSNCINAGTDLGDTYTNGLNKNSSWVDSVNTLNQDLYGSGWEMGAYVYSYTTMKNATLKNCVIK